MAQFLANSQTRTQEKSTLIDLPRSEPYRRVFLIIRYANFSKTTIISRLVASLRFHIYCYLNSSGKLPPGGLPRKKVIKKLAVPTCPQLFPVDTRKQINYFNS